MDNSIITLKPLFETIEKNRFREYGIYTNLIWNEALGIVLEYYEYQNHIIERQRLFREIFKSLHKGYYENHVPYTLMANKVHALLFRFNDWIYTNKYKPLVILEPEMKFDFIFTRGISRYQNEITIGDLPPIYFESTPEIQNYKGKFLKSIRFVHDDVNWTCHIHTNKCDETEQSI